MRKSVVIAEALCLVGAAAIGLIYSDRLNRERERREHIEATGAKAERAFPNVPFDTEDDD